MPIYIPRECKDEETQNRYRSIAGLVSYRHSYRLYVESVMSNICSESNFITQLLKEMGIAEDHYLFCAKSSVMQQLEAAKESIDALLRDLILEVDRQSQDSFQLEESGKSEFNLEHRCRVNDSGDACIAGCVVSFRKNTFLESVTVRLSCNFPLQVSIRV